MCRAVDQHGQVIDVLLLEQRDLASAEASFRRALDVRACWRRFGETEPASVRRMASSMPMTDNCVNIKPPMVIDGVFTEGW